MLLLFSSLDLRVSFFGESSDPNGINVELKMAGMCSVLECAKCPEGVEVKRPGGAGGGDCEFEGGSSGG